MALCPALALHKTRCNEPGLLVGKSRPKCGGAKVELRPDWAWRPSDNSGPPAGGYIMPPAARRTLQQNRVERFRCEATALHFDVFFPEHGYLCAVQALSGEWIG
jgi:hypothetical protein